MCADVRADVRADMCVDMYIDMCVDMCTDIRIGMCVSVVRLASLKKKSTPGVWSQRRELTVPRPRTHTRRPRDRKPHFGYDTRPRDGKKKSHLSLGIGADIRLTVTDIATFW